VGSLKISAIAGASVLGLTSMMGPGVAFGADTAVILGGSGLPIPSQSYVAAADELYLVPNGYDAYTPQVLGTPEQWYPVTGVNSLPVDTSVAQGMIILDGAITPQIAAGNRVVVFGYSQGSSVASQEMAQLASSGKPPDPNQLSFVLVGDPNNPNGGLFARFDVPGVGPLTLPSLGTTFGGATPSNAYPTAIYTQEYDGFADFPQYPINLLADLNAELGLFYQHLTYLNLTPQQINSAILLPTVGPTTTQYYMIPTADLPLLEPVRLIPLIGNPLADLLQPDLRVLVNLGYGSITKGWSTGPANVPTPFGLFPTNINPVDVLTALANGAVQGVTDALNDLKTRTLVDTSSLSRLSAAFHTLGLTPSNNPSLLQVVAAFSTLGNAGVPVTSSGGIINTLTSVVAHDLSVARPLADTALALAVSLAEYDAKLFVNQIAAGNLLGAIGMPIAADLALVPHALLIGAIFPIVEAVATAATKHAELDGLEPNPPGPAASTAKTAASANARAAPPIVGAVAATLTRLAEFAGLAPNPTSTATSIVAETATATTSIVAKTTAASSNRAPSSPGVTGGLVTAVTGSGARAPAVGAVTGVTGTSGSSGSVQSRMGTSRSSGSTGSTAGIGLHRRHGQRG
jgi:hypothetical protein